MNRFDNNGFRCLGRLNCSKLESLRYSYLKKDTFVKSNQLKYYLVPFPQIINKNIDLLLH